MTAFCCPLSSTHSCAPSAVVEPLQQPAAQPLYPLPVGQISELRVKSIFRNGFNVICAVQSPPQKYSASSSPQISARVLFNPPPMRDDGLKRTLRELHRAQTGASGEVLARHVASIRAFPCTMSWPISKLGWTVAGESSNC